MSLRARAKREIHAPQPSAAEAPEVFERAISRCAEARRRWRAHPPAAHAERRRVFRADLPVHTSAHRLLQKADGRAGAVIDGGIEMHESQRRRQLRTTGGFPVVGEIDVAHGLRGRCASGHP